MGKKNQSMNISLKLLTAQFSKGLKNVQRQLNTFGNFIKSAFALGTVTAFGRKMVEVGSDFEDAMSRVQSVSNASRIEFKMMQNEAKRMGATTRYSASEAASALENLVRNGLSATQATKALSGTMALAGANAIDLATAADITTNTMNAFGLGVGQISRINDVMSSTCANSATNINLLYEAMTVAGPYAKIMGKTIEETSAALGLLANKGIKGSGAGKALAAMYQRLASQSPKATKALQEFGLEISEEDLKTQSLTETLRQLQQSGIGNSVAALSEAFGKNFAGDIAQLINNVDELETLLGKVSSSAGTTERMFKQGIGSTKNELATLKSMYEDFLITMSEKTRGLVNGAIKVLQGLIANFKTVGGTIMNIASVVVPLLTKKIISLVKSFKTLFTVMKTEGAAATAMMGGWITAVISLVTWVGTALVGAWSKATQAMREAKKEVKTTNAEITRTQGIAKTLINELGPETNEKSLAGICKRLCDLFPDMGEAIKQAFKDSGKDVESLKKKLESIIALQAKISANAAKTKLLDAQTSHLSKVLYQGTANNTVDQTRKQLKNMGYSKDDIKAVFDVIADAFVNAGSKDNATSIVEQYLKELGVKVGEADVKHFVDGYYNLVPAQNARKTKGEIDANNTVIDKAEADAAAKKFRQELESSATELGVKFSDAMSDLDLQKAIDNARGKNTNKLSDAVDESEKLETKSNKIKEDLNGTLSNIQDDLHNNFINTDEALKRLTDAYKKAYEELRGLTGATGESNPYFNKYKGLSSKEMGLREGLGLETVDKIQPIQNNIVAPQAQVQTPSTGLAMPTPQVSGQNLDNMFGMDAAIEQMNSFNSMLGTAFSSVTGIANAFETLGDSESTWTDKLGAALSIMQGMTGILETVNTLTKVGAALTAAQIPIEGELATTKTAGAIASIFSGNGEIPIAGIAIAAAGVAALIAALASAPKFASGGYVQGSLHGDRNYARVNGGELILNGSQQKNLWNLINGRGANDKPQQVEFILRGKTATALVNNYNKSIQPTISVL